MSDASTIITALQKANAYPHPVDPVIKKLETHISWVFLTGEYAYKIKKPVNFGFIDYSTLEKRKHFCEQEIKLNQALASSIYLQMVTINKTAEGYEINGTGEVVEYALKMKEFSQENLLDHLLARNELTVEMVDNIAMQLAHFHMQAERAPSDSPYGKPETVKAPVDENFVQARELLNAFNIATANYLTPLESLEKDSEKIFEAIHPTLEKRKKEGFIRSCHGDLHLGNITLIDHQPIIFDCIEFNEYFRWTDVMADVGFLLMDFYDRDRSDLGMRFLNTYLTYTGDYEGLRVLPYYFSYRAMVRAKIQLFSINKDDNEKKREAYYARFAKYMNLALNYFHRSPAFLLIMHGFSGSGKSTLANRIAEKLNGIIIRSDVERKRLFDFSPEKKLDEKAYSSDITEKTYARLHTLTDIILHAGYPVIIDATFLKESQRKGFIDYTKNQKIPFSIIHCDVDASVLIERMGKREKEADAFSDADLNVLKMQQAAYEPLTEEEKKVAVSINTNKKSTLLDTMSELNGRLER